MNLMPYETRGILGSFLFFDIVLKMKALTSTDKLTVFVSLLGVQNDLRNLAYVGTCLIASNKGTLISSCSKSFINSSFSNFFFFAFNFKKSAEINGTHGSYLTSCVFGDSSMVLSFSSSNVLYYKAFELGLFMTLPFLSLVLKHL